MDEEHCPFVRFQDSPVLRTGNSDIELKVRSERFGY